jgi:hypothetical protein
MAAPETAASFIRISMRLASQVTRVASRGFTLVKQHPRVALGILACLIALKVAAPTSSKGAADMKGRDAVSAAPGGSVESVEKAADKAQADYARAIGVSRKQLPVGDQETVPGLTVFRDRPAILRRITVVRKLNSRDFPSLTQWGRHVYGIEYGVPGILVTDSGFSSPGVAQRMLRMKAQITVTMNSGFTETLDVFQEVQGDEEAVPATQR